MSAKLLFNPADKDRPMRVAAFMSGSGTNIIKLLELQNQLKEKDGASSFNVIFIFSDRSDGSCKGETIALEAGIPYFSHDIRRFHSMRGLKREVITSKGLEARKEFDKVAARLIEAFDIDVIALGGYMSYITLPRCVNVHPADLSVLTTDGKRKYVGDHAVPDAISAGEKTLRSSTLWTDEGVDTGPLLMVSPPLTVELPESLEVLLSDKKKLVQVSDEHQERLKEIGDWKIFPKTVEMIAGGRFSIDSENRIYVDGNLTPDGHKE